MASLSSPPFSVASFAASKTHHSNSSFFRLFGNHKSEAPKIAKPTQYHISRVSCNCNPKENDNAEKFNRRNVLLGLGGLINTVSNNPFSLDNGTPGFVSPAAQAAETPNNPSLILDSTVSFVVERPKKFGSMEEQEEEYLVIEGIEFDRNEVAKFDVLVNAKDFAHLVPADAAEYAGNFYNVPHGFGGPQFASTTLTLPLTYLLEELEAEDDDSVVVTLVPKCGQVTIRNVRIQFGSDW